MKSKIKEINNNLFDAAEYGRFDEVKQALFQGADPNYQRGRYSVLQRASLNDRLEIAEYLLQNGADPNLKSKIGHLTPLIVACSGEMVRLLARYNVDPYITDRENGKGFNAFVYYALDGQLDAVKAWMGLGWRIPENIHKAVDRLLAHEKFEMIETITGFKFSADTPWGKIAEFKSQYKSIAR